MAKVRRKTRVARRRRRATRPTAGTPGPPAPDLTPDLASLAGPLNIMAKSFAVVAMRLALGRPADGEGKKVGQRAQFLERLGLGADDIAPVLGSTPPSVRELLSRARRKGRKRGRRGK